MKRWGAYILIGALFGIVDYFYLPFLYAVPFEQALGSSAVGQAAAWIVDFIILNLGLWLLPVVPIALHQARQSRSAIRAAIAGVCVWCSGIISYYLTNAAQLLLLDVPGRHELHISNRASEVFSANWAGVLRGDVLRGITEWIPVAIIGGALVGFLVGWMQLRRLRVVATATMVSPLQRP